MTPKALITGITGQDGRYLADLLLDNGYEVHGLKRPGAERDTPARLWRLGGILHRITLHTASLTDPSALRAVLAAVQPHQVYHLAAQSSVSASFHDPVSTYRNNIEGTQNVLSAIHEMLPGTRTYFAASCEMFGIVDRNPANEQTPMRPVSPYGISKLAGYHTARMYRDARGLPVTCGIAFNHDSPLRGAEFVTSKIARAAARIAAGLEDFMAIGNLDVHRDWGFAPDYAQAMFELMTKQEPDDFVLATGKCTSLENLLDAAFHEAGLEWRNHTRCDPALVRPADIRELYGDPTKARKAIGWSARTSGEAVIRMMVRHEMQQLAQAVTQ
jgi:GDPmannose 4,6-dehydratase